MLLNWLDTVLLSLVYTQKQTVGYVAAKNRAMEGSSVLLHALRAGETEHIHLAIEQDVYIY